MALTAVSKPDTDAASGGGSQRTSGSGAGTSLGASLHMPASMMARRLDTWLSVTGTFFEYCDFGQNSLKKTHANSNQKSFKIIFLVKTGPKLKISTENSKLTKLKWLFEFLVFLSFASEI